MTLTTTPLPDRTPQRVRHELRMRVLEVRRVERVTPSLVRVTLGGKDLAGFSSPGFDDHVKLFFPNPTTGKLALPSLLPFSAKPVARDFTPLHFDATALELQIDFALHESGPAAQFARQARPGQQLGVGGPKGSFLLPTAFDWHLLIGDDTALPAISRRLAELPAGTRALVLAEVDGPADELPLKSAAELSVHWVHRHASGGGAPRQLVEALPSLVFPAGDYHAWIAGESSAAKALRTHLISVRGANPKWMKAAGYWRRGSAGAHEKIED